jgi:hypothetical protein
MKNCSPVGNHFDLSVALLADGIYLLEIASEKNKYVIKFIKE